MKYVRIHPLDNVAIALEPLGEGTLAGLSEGIAVRERIERGHKIALRDIMAGEDIVKYGCPIGHASKNIQAGEWVHTHNMATNLATEKDYAYKPKAYPLPEPAEASFLGYRRKDGRVATRNEVWILPTVGCVSSLAEHLAAKNQKLIGNSIDGIYAFTHPYGCSQMGDDHAQTRKLLAALARHPNAGGVLILGLGCENLTMEQFREELGEYDSDRVKFLICQKVEDEYKEASRLLSELVRYAGTFQREPIDASELIVGLKCGGSDGLSGITANPAVGSFTEYLVAVGGSAVLTEVPEMFGAETLLLERCCSEEIFTEAVGMINGFKHYYISHGQVVYENPSPGNKAGGISTLEDKSCGCIQKGGHAPVTGVLSYGDAVKKKGLNLLSGPGNDLVSTTALTAAGAHLILFTTGRGTPFGAPVPTVKISTNTQLYRSKPRWIDFDAGTVAEGESIDSAGKRLFACVLEVASGKATNNEINEYREISIFKDGVVL